MPARLHSAFSKLLSADPNARCAVIFFREASSNLLASTPEGLEKQTNEWRQKLPATDWNRRLFSARTSKESLNRTHSQWILSRSALVGSLAQLEEEAPLTPDELREVRLSLSHTGKSGDGAAAAVAVLSREAKKIGVDLELENRVVSDGVFRKFHREKELKIEMNPLIHWVLKEACWKAHPRAEETLVSQYEITSKEKADDVFFYTLRCESVPNDFRAFVAKHEGFLIAVATSL